MRRLIALLPLLLAIGLGALFYERLKEGPTDKLPSMLIGKPAPAFPEAGLEGYAQGDIPAILASGRPVIVNFFASWCPPCRAEHPHLIALSKRGVPIIGINYKDEAEDAAAFLEELDNPFLAIRVDEDGRVGIEWGVAGVPESFIIGAGGKIVTRHAGPITSRDIKDAILPYLGERDWE